MYNYEIADNFSLLSKLIDIHGDDPVKAKIYSSVAFNIDNLPVELSSIPEKKIPQLKGIGESSAKKILEMLSTGHLSELDDYLEKTPAGILEMLRIKNLGPKKIATIWKELKVDTIDSLLYACNQNRLVSYKGFGKKTQENIKEAIDFYLNNSRGYLYAQVEEYAHAWEEKIASWFPKNKFLSTGEFLRQLLTIDKLEWITDAGIEQLKKAFKSKIYSITTSGSVVKIQVPENLLLQFCCAKPGLIFTNLFKTSCSKDFFEAWQNKFGWENNRSFSSEEEIFRSQKVNWIPPFMREKPSIIEKALKRKIPKVVTGKDIKGLIHSHSNWSDGSNTIEQLVKGCIKNRYEYLVVSDHSKAAYYAGGLPEEKLHAQHELIEELNKKYKPFRIFKSIEADILSDGRLDYDEDVLKTFDLVITSVHSNLKMNEEKAMMRLMNAIANPYTTILGHMTGRLLLSRRGYPIDHGKIIDACAKNNVVIEINAHPRRLDMDWKWIDVALEKGVLISINPDAHSIGEFENIKYGVLAAQKGGLTKEQNLSSYTLEEFIQFLKKQKEKRKRKV